MCVWEILREFAAEVICIMFTAIDIYLYGERGRHSRFPVSFRSVRCPQRKFVHECVFVCVLLLRPYLRDIGVCFLVR
jgi:hypothetical protein